MVIRSVARSRISISLNPCGPLAVLLLRGDRYSYNVSDVVPCPLPSSAVTLCTTRRGTVKKVVPGTSSFESVYGGAKNRCPVNVAYDIVVSLARPLGKDLIMGGSNLLSQALLYSL